MGSFLGRAYTALCALVNPCLQVTQVELMPV